MAASKGEKKRDYILDKAKELFIQKGYAGTSMEDLVQYSGVSKGSIYYHFKSKEELFLHLIDKDAREWLAGWREKEKHYPTFAEKLYGLAEYYADELQNPLQKVTEEFLLGQSLQTDVLHHALQHMRTRREACTKIFQKAVDSGEISAGAPEELAIIFLGLLDGLTSLYYERSQDEIQALYRQAVTCFLKGILPR